MSAMPVYFPCPQCGNRKLWKSELAGKRAKCGCGHILTVPTEQEMGPTGLEDDGELMLAPAPVVVPKKVTTIAAATVVVEREEADGSVQTVAAGARSRIVVDPSRTMHHKPLAREKPKEEAYVFSPVWDGILPGILIVAGVALCFAAGSYQGDGRWLSVQQITGPVVLNILTSLVLVVVAVFAASAMGGVCFREPPAVMIFKLCAIALAPGALGQLAETYLGDGINGNMAIVFVSLACYIALFALLFKMDMSDRVICIALIFIIRGGVTYLIFRFEGAKAGSPI